MKLFDEIVDRLLIEIIDTERVSQRASQLADAGKPQRAAAAGPKMRHRRRSFEVDLPVREPGQHFRGEVGALFQERLSNRVD